MSRLTFVVGKGGVGKTTVSCALVLHLAAKNPRQSILLLSTDPAHSLADMLEIKTGTTPRKVAGVNGKLSLWQIDSAREFDKFLSDNREGILNIVENGTFFSREEIAPLLDTTLPGMAEVAGLLAIQELLHSGRHDHIVVDTAPFGHTLRLFELPAHFQRFLDFLDVASSRDALLARRFGGRVTTPAHAFLERWQAMVKEVRAAFTSRLAEILLVTTPETFSLNEAVRSLEALRESTPEMHVEGIVLNRAVTAPGKCSRCRRRAMMAGNAEQFLKTKFPRIPRLIGPDPGNPLLGAKVLRTFGDVIFDGRAAKLSASVPRSTRTATKFAKTKWPQIETRLGFTVGKGGVGKTTTTAALAFHTRSQHQDVPVTVCSTDPAPSLDDVFQKEIGNEPVKALDDDGFSAMEMDSVSEFRNWAARIKGKLNSATSMESGGLHVDLTFEKEVFAALMDVVPPGVDEVFAIFRILDLLESKPGKVFIDMAPTGHALELLRMPERILLWSRLLLKSLASHRTLTLAQDVAVDLAGLGQRVRRLLEIMRDPKQSRAWVVMLPEPVPDRQTQRLLSAMDGLGIAVDSMFVNRVLMEPGGRCKHCSRAQQWQMATLQSWRKKYGRLRTYLLREFPGEIAGAAALKKFTSELWEIQSEK
ncbi:MAG TPA: TRC40/GET3/ArsA family transport-energizing ATPase [Candidatus Angelobacter sp.]|nr:TRC40/GET3/ArsA family transport-energizing ATPase [Candidatus Angelobacter sp.]